jgi:ankyrin repeat protein
VVKLLLQRGAEVGARNVQGQTARERAEEARCEAVVAILDEHMPQVIAAARW